MSEYRRVGMGYLRYSPDQPRDPNGEWSGGGSGEWSSGVENSDVKVSKVDGKNQDKIVEAISGLPDSHLKMAGKVRIVSKHVVKTMQGNSVAGLTTQGTNRDEPTTISIADVGQPDSGPERPIKNPGAVAVHEFGHVIDASSGREYSNKLWPVLQNDIGSLSKAQQYLAKHYNSPREGFAELYRLAYGPGKGAFSLGQKEGERKFSKSLSKIYELLGPRSSSRSLDLISHYFGAGWQERCS